MLRSALRGMEKRFGLRVVRASSERRARIADLSAENKATIDSALPYTMTTVDRLAALCMSVENVVANNVPGAFVECGVWRGGSSMAAALTYLRLGRNDVDLFLFDTFAGMSQPTEEDVHAGTGRSAKEDLDSSDRTAEIWAYSPLEEVRRNMITTGYPVDHLHFVQGMVEETLPSAAPDQIAILRLDTDFYESTKHELNHLFPRLSKNGILIIDDYGAWTGARKAVDEYFASFVPRPFLFRIDTTGRLCLKP